MALFLKQNNIGLIGSKMHNEDDGYSEKFSRDGLVVQVYEVFEPKPVFDLHSTLGNLAEVFNNNTNALTSVIVLA